MTSERTLGRAPTFAFVTALMGALVGCGGHEARTIKLRSALDVGDGRAAIRALNDELEVKSANDLPKDIRGDNALLVLDRASVQQGVGEFRGSKRDFEAADKAIDMLDLARNAGDSIGEYVFSGSSGRYQAPPYEKLMINTLNMLNYLEMRDLNGARIEARRLSVIQKYYRDTLSRADNPVLGLGSMLAGFTFEKSGENDEALRYYDESLVVAGQSHLSDVISRLATLSQYRTPRITKLLRDRDAAAETHANETGEVLFVVGYGRVAHKVANRIPIGLALTYFASSINPTDAAAANKLAAQGLVTWINFPSLADGPSAWEMPHASLDGVNLRLEEAVDVDREVRAEWKKLEGKIIVSAITRLIARAAVGQGVQTAGGRDNLVSILVSLGLQATLTALDTPDTRSWETLPARVAVARMRLPLGRHHVSINARGWQREEDVQVTKDSWQVVSLMALR